MSNYLIGIDCGTTAMKGVVCDAAGAVMAHAQRPIPLHTPQPGWAEQQPDEVWHALVEIVRDLSAQIPTGIRAISIGAQAGSVIPADANGVPVSPMITFLDTRATSLIDVWTHNGWRDDIRHITGWGLQPGQPLLSIAWLRDHQPEVFAQAQRYIEPHDDLVRRLTGVLIGNPSCAAQMPLIERETGQWSASIAGRVGISTAHLPVLATSGSVVGEVLPEVAAWLGLPADTLVINGGQDHACEALALQLIEPGSLMLATGTAWVITGVTRSAEIGSIPAQMDLNAHVVPERWTISTYMGGFGAIVEWWLKATPLAEDRYGALQRALATAPPGSHGLLFAPESVTRPASAFAGLKLNHSWADMTRAIVEGIAFEVRTTVEQLRAANLPVNTLHMLGGAARNTQWRTTLADVLDVPIQGCDDPFLGARGAAVLAGIGAGMYGASADGWPRYEFTEALTSPSPHQKQPYDEQFARYADMARAKIT